MTVESLSRLSIDSRRCFHSPSGPAAFTAGEGNEQTRQHLRKASLALEQVSRVSGEVLGNYDEDF